MFPLQIERRDPNNQGWASNYPAHHLAKHLSLDLGDWFSQKIWSDSNNHLGHLVSRLNLATEWVWAKRGRQTPVEKFNCLKLIGEQFHQSWWHFKRRTKDKASQGHNGLTEDPNSRTKKVKIKKADKISRKLHYILFMSQSSLKRKIQKKDG